jgi:DNA topoisomerase-1
MTKLVIVESPAKAKTIQQYLGGDYRVLATIGHIRELPKKDAIDPANNYAMTYITIPGKEEAIKKITDALKDVEEVILATDPDREGEAIAWHVSELLKTKHAKKINGKEIKRAVFYEISKEAVKDAVSKPRDIALDLVESQETRRALDRHFGFTLSPLLWRLFPSNNHSAGRVQSPALRMIVEREKEIEAFVPQEYWTVGALLQKEEKIDVKLTLYENEPVKKFTFVSSALVESATTKLETGCKNGMRVASVVNKQIKRGPKAPFRTSVLMQQASAKFSFTPKDTMRYAQSLFARGDKGDGLITYIRTDSIEIDKTKLPLIQQKVVALYGEDFLERRKFKNKKEAKNTQEAHGAITPVDINILPDSLKTQLSDNEFKLYNLIWERTIASQMKDAIFERTTIEFVPNGLPDLASFVFSEQKLLFPGYLLATKEEVRNKKPPNIKEGDVVDFLNLTKEQHFTEPPPRFNDASMIKALEEKGIGRPSTYAGILSRLLDRAYIISTQRRYEPSDMGRLVSNFLNGSFADYINDEFTSKMENNLDAISNGSKSKKDVLDQFWSPLEEEVATAGKKLTRRDVNPQRLLGTDPEVNKPIFARMTKNGPAVQRGDIDAGDDPEWRALKKGQKLFSITYKEGLDLFKATDSILGTHPDTNAPIIVRETRFGPVVQLGTNEDGNKPRYVSLIKGENMEEVGLERALQYLSLPRDVGKDPESGETIFATMGPYGPYLKRGSQNFSLRKGCDPFTVGLDEALTSIASKKGSTNIKEFEDSNIKIKEGRWGSYITNGKLNVSVPKNTDPKTLTEEDCLALLDAKQKKNKNKKKKKR